MQPRSLAVADSAWLYRVAHPDLQRILVTSDAVRMEGLLGAASTEIPIDCIDEIPLRRSCFWVEFTVLLADGTKHSIGGLAEQKAAGVRAAIFEESARIAESLGKRLKYLAGQLSAKRYIRHFDSQEIHERLVSLVTTVRQSGKLVRGYIDQETREGIVKLQRLESIEAFEKERERLNDIYIQRSVPSVKTAAGSNLTDEQAEAIATDEDVTLVLAGAGTGKTKVIVGKVAHLVQNQGVNPAEILLLAYNTDAAAEMRARLPDDLSGTCVSTFNAFGNSVIGGSEGRKRLVSELAEDDKKLRSAVDDILSALLYDPQQSRVVIKFILNHRNPRRSAFDFKTVSEYRQYVNSIELRSLSGDMVKSHEELTIANFLTENGIDFTYEIQYEVDTAVSQYRQYRPDFFLRDYDIYIEHFALDEKGHPPSGWHDYAQGVKWKRGIHREHNTTLIETYSWQFRQGILIRTLRAKLERMGVKFELIPTEKLVEKLGEERISWLSKLLITFLGHVRGGNLKLAELQDRARKLKDRDRQRDIAFLDVFEQVRIRYEKLLEDVKEIDFHDQINLAAEHIRQGRWEPPFRYVLVDEFQDISKGRMRLLQSLMRRNVAYFLVGDDWQSIYRFSGSDVGLVRNCSRYLGYVQERTLSRTFRFRNGILEPSTMFIKRNPEQTQRRLRSESGAEDGGITIVAYGNDEGSQWALQDIEAKAEDKAHSVLVLGRYNRSKEALTRNWKSRYPAAKFSTVHRSKGREADYVVMLDLKDDKWGFPSKVEDDPLLDIVLRPVCGAAFPFAEERRLFYVAMTRAKIGGYLVTDSVWPSAFVEELRKHTNLRQVGTFAPKCPRCAVGVLVERKGPFSVFMGCTEYGAEPSCRYTKKIDIESDTRTDG